MKKLLLLFLTTFMTATFIQAQIVISEDTISMSQGMNNGFTLELSNTTAKSIAKDWAKHLKQFKSKKTKYNKKTKEYFTDNAKIKMMSSNTVDIYTIIAPMGDDTKIMVCFDLGGAYLSSKLHPTSAKLGQQILYDFAVKIKQEQVKEKIVVQEKELKSLESDMKKLEKGEDEIRKSIKELQEKIAKLEKEVENSKQAQTDKFNEIEAQKQAILQSKKFLTKIK